MEKEKLKAYIVSDKWNDAGSIVVWAETSGKAKALRIIKQSIEKYRGQNGNI